MDDTQPVYIVDGQDPEEFAKLFNHTGITPLNETLTSHPFGKMSVYDQLAIASVLVILGALLLGFIVQFNYDRNEKKKELERETKRTYRRNYPAESNV